MLKKISSRFSFILIFVLILSLFTACTTKNKIEISLNITDNNGTVIFSDNVSANENDTIFDVTKKVCIDNKIQFDFSGISGSQYVKGINNLYEFDFGGESGWLCKQNGEFITKSCGAAKLLNDDKIEWIYVTEYKNF